MENFISKFGHKNDMVYKKEFTVVLTFKVVVPHNLTLILDELYQKTSICVNRMLEDRTKSSAAFNISANGWFFYEQTVGHSASAVGHIGGLLNQSSEKAVQLESSGGAR